MVKSGEESEERARLLDSPEHPEQSDQHHHHQPHHQEQHHHQPVQQENQSPYSRKKIYRNNPLNLQQPTTFHFG